MEEGPEMMIRKTLLCVPVLLVFLPVMLSRKIGSIRFLTARRRIVFWPAMKSFWLRFRTNRFPRT